METLQITLYANPFPLMVVDNFYNEEELNLIWEELNFYTRPEKLLSAEGYGGIVDRTNAKALLLSEIHGCCSIANESNHDITKVRYYHDGEYYDPHTDKGFQFLAFSYFYKEPKKFTGGDLVFPKYDFKLPCENNSMVIFPGWVEHGVRKVTIDNSDYFDGWGRYCISSFFGVKPRQMNQKNIT